MTTMQMYWFVKLDDIICLIELLAFISGMWTAIHGIRWINWVVDEKYDTPTTAPKMCAWGVVVTTLFIAVATFIPSTKQLAAIMIVPRIVNNEKVQTVGNELYTLAFDWLKELHSEKEKK